MRKVRIDDDDSTVSLAGQLWGTTKGIRGDCGPADDLGSLLHARALDDCICGFSIRNWKADSLLQSGHQLQEEWPAHR